MKLSRPFYISTLCLAATITSACTTQAWYGGAKQGAENQCRLQPPSEAERCLENANKKTYDEYEKERTNAK
jgi:hypothetical protein